MPPQVRAIPFDPYRAYRFRVQIDGKDVAGLSKCSALKRTTEVTSWREAGSSVTSRQIPGKTKFEPVTLEQGITTDTTFEDWALSIHRYLAGSADPVDFRRELTLVVHNQAGQPVLAYLLHRCWVSEYQALPDLDANANAIAIAHIKIENEGWERDSATTDPGTF